MTKRILSLFLLLCVFIPAAGCGSGTVPGGSPGASATTAPTPTATVPTTPEPTPTPDPVQARLDAMTTEEKVGQLLMAGFEGTEPGGDDTVFLQDYQVGGLILFGRNIESAEQLTALTNGLKTLNGDQIPLLIGVDQEGGLVDRMPPEVHRTPGAYAVGSTSDWDQGRALGAALAAECAGFGFHLDFAPVLDVWSNPDNTVIGKRAFGSDWKVVSGFGAAVSNALQAAGVIPVVKHFPGHGDTVVDSHMGLPVVDKSLEDLSLQELPPFRDLISGGETPSGRAEAVPAVMVAHILMTQLDPDLPASLSPAVVTDLLRGELGFGGVVFTDDLTMGAITQNYGLGEAAVLAVEAGCDMLLVCHGRDSVDAARSALLEAAASGRISQARLDESVRRILSLKLEYGVSGEPVSAPDVNALNALVDAVAAQ